MSHGSEGKGGYRTIRVTAKAKGYGKLTVRTREGYQANPSTGKKTVGTVPPPGEASDPR